jgi:hypothetical protein
MKAEGTIEKFAVAVAIGSLLLLGLFLIADSRADSFLGLFEHVSASPAWGVVAAVPTITLTYTLGAFVMVLSDLVFSRLFPKAHREEWRTLERLALRGSDLLNQEFEDIKRTKRLLEGSVFPLVILALGVYCDQRRLSDLSSLLNLCSAAIFLCACSIPLVAMRLQHMLVRVGEIAVASVHEPNTKSTTTPN